LEYKYDAPNSNVMGPVRLLVACRLQQTDVSVCGAWIMLVLDRRDLSDPLKRDAITERYTFKL